MVSIERKKKKKSMILIYNMYIVYIPSYRYNSLTNVRRYEYFIQFLITYMINLRN